MRAKLLSMFSSGRRLLSKWVAGRRLALLLLLVLMACDTPGDGDDDIPCSAADYFEAEACEEAYCGPAAVRIGMGASGFESLESGQEVPIWYGSQGGYHLSYSVEMENLCPIVFVRINLLIDPGDGSLVSLHEQERHVQAYRAPGGDSSLQSYWGINGFVPCEYWPFDADNEPSCAEGAGSSGHLEDFEVVMRVEVEDHSGRMATDERRVQPVCCS